MSVRNIDYGSVRYTQEYLYPTFANGKMSVSETYVALANGFLDPASLAAITIFEHNDHLYCIDTRRLTIAKELQRRNKLDVLKNFPFQYVKKGDAKFAKQYSNLVNDRLPATKKEGLDGSTIKLDSEREHMCCYKSTSGIFRDDLDEHIARDHLEISFSTFKELNVCQCSQCGQKLRIRALKPPNKPNYSFVQNCTCRNSRPSVLQTMEKPWSEVTLREICDVFLRLQEPLLYNMASIKYAGNSANSRELSNEPTVPSAPQLPHQVKEVEDNGLIKQSLLFSLLFVIIAILFGLYFFLFQIK